MIEIPTNHPLYLKKKINVKRKEKILSKPSDGKIIGQHYGAHFFTIGQRKGLDIGGKKEPLFVIQTDVINNIIYVGMGENIPDYLRKV